MFGNFRGYIVVRRISQTVFLLLFVYVLWSTTYPLRGPIPPEIIFKIDPLLVFFVSLSERVILPGIFLSGVLVLSALVLGRFFCGWICPLGTFNDWLSSLRKRKAVPGEPQNRKIRKIKFGILAVIGICALGGFQAAWFFDPLVIMARFISLNLIPTVTLGLGNFFITGIRSFGLYGGFYDFYHELRNTVLGVSVYYFSNSVPIFVFFSCLSLPVLFVSRIWCRMLCPLGALYALAAKGAILERKVGNCTGCMVCRSDCRMGAIEEGGRYAKGECILCMDCLYTCPANVTSFGWRKTGGLKTKPGDMSGGHGVTRKDFLFLLFSAAALSFLTRSSKTFAQPFGRPLSPVLRPPGALKEEAFLDRCIRCGNCMKVCVTNGLQPVMLEAGWSGLWTPQLVPEIGYCEYQCHLCGNVCPTGAIPKLTSEEKKLRKIGIAVIARNICLPWGEDKNCIVCEEHCPTPEKAIKLEEDSSSGRKMLKPVVRKDLCIGCGICQKVCPVRPARAVRVVPLSNS
jgi:polyferredoxin